MDGWRAEMRSQRPAFLLSTLPTTPPLRKNGDVSLGRAGRRKFYQIGTDATKLFKTPTMGQTMGLEIASRKLTVQWGRQATPWVMPT